MNFILLLVVGGVIGWLASIVMKTNAQMGLVANVIVGIVGAALGGWVAGILGIGAFGTLGSWIIGIAGAVLLIVILKAIGIFK